MDRFDEMRAKTAKANSGGDTPGGGSGGSSGFNIYTQSSEPAKKDGIWIKNGGSSTVYFSSYAGKKGEFIDSEAFGYLKTTDGIIGQVIVGDYLYSFGTSSSTSYKYNLKTKKYIGNLNVPSVTAQTSKAQNIGAVYYAEKNCIYVLFRGPYNSSNYYPYMYIYYPDTNTYNNSKQFGGVTGAGYSTAPLLYDNKIYWWHSNGSATRVLAILDLETNTLTNKTAIGPSLTTTYIYASCASGKYIYYNYQNGIGRIDCEKLTYETLGNIGDSSTYGLGYSMFVSGGSIYVFLGKSSSNLNYYCVFDIGTKVSNIYSTNVNYKLSSTINQSMPFDPASGILYIRTSADPVQAFQLEDAPALKELPAKTTVVVQDLGYRKTILLQDSSNLQIGVSDVYVVDDSGELDWDVTCFYGDGVSWKLLKNPTGEKVTVTFETDGGSSVEEQEVMLGQTATKPESPTKNGYIFDTWLLDGKPFDFNLTITNSITLTAKWLTYEEIDYIESTGTQYIDTGVKAVQGKNYEIDSEWILTGSSGNKCLYGAQPSQRSLLCFVYEDIMEAHFTSGSSTAKETTCGFKFNFNTKYAIKHKTNTSSKLIEATVNGETLPNFTYSGDIDTTANIWLFNNNGQTGQNINAKLFSFKIYEDGILTRDYVPIKTEDGVYCLLDKVNNIAYANAGTGLFIGGSEQEAAALNYIETTGTQYIDTGCYVDADFEWQMDFQFTDLSAGMWNGTGESTSASTGICASTSYNNFMIGVNNGSWSSKETTILKDTTRHTLDFKSGSQKIDGTQVGDYVFNSVKGQNTFPLGVFITVWDSSPTTYSNYCKMKIYSCKILSNGTLVRDFIPMKDGYGVACLYDKVTETYFYNAGTGSFVAG